MLEEEEDRNEEGRLINYEGGEEMVQSKIARGHNYTTVIDRTNGACTPHETTM